LEGYTVYPINPKLSKNWREGSSVAGVKSDRRDCLMLATELARRHESLRALAPAAQDLVNLASLCKKLRQLIGERTALIQKLKAALNSYYPAALEFFSDFTSPAAWRFIKRFPNPVTLAHAKKNTLFKFLKANHIGLSPTWQERVERSRKAADWPRPPDAQTHELTAQACAAQLMALQVYIDSCDALIRQNSKDLPELALMKSLPGAGERLSPPMAVMVALMQNMPERLQAMRCLSGVAPVQRESGKRCEVHIRRRCNKHWRDVLHLFAWCSTKHCSWAKAYYALCRERGDTYATALRKLANKWLKIIDRMLATREPYDDQRYVKSLCQRRSPIAAKLAQAPVDNTVENSA
jgi:transposase